MKWREQSLSLGPARRRRSGREWRPARRRFEGNAVGSSLSVRSCFDSPTQFSGWLIKISRLLWRNDPTETVGRWARIGNRLHAQRQQKATGLAREREAAGLRNPAATQGPARGSYARTAQPRVSSCPRLWGWRGNRYATRAWRRLGRRHSEDASGTLKHRTSASARLASPSLSVIGLFRNNLSLDCWRRAEGWPGLSQDQCSPPRCR